ncbi:MAG TPA: PQQ-dependent sugar dehydrogenase, partial [Labilithrix sp.]|nr:PQQ-dependent sugar dehydrogenase [Labilithrix sp.]
MRAPLRAALVLGLGGVLTFVACDERLPRSLGEQDAGTPAPAWGLDARPTGTTCKGPGAAATPAATISLARVSPIVFAHPTGVVEHDGRLYVLQQGSSGPVGATVRLLSADTTQATTVIDVSSRVVPGGEAGLLGLAFHPKFAQNHFAYLYYLSPHPQ